MNPDGNEPLGVPSAWRPSALSMLRRHKDGAVLFHTLTGCLDVVSGAFGHWLADVWESQLLHENPGPFGSFSKQLAGLAARGHVTSLSLSEEQTLFLQYFRMVRWLNRHLQRQTGYLMLALSYACNLDCPYCFQRDIRASLGDVRLAPKDIDAIWRQVQPALCPDVPAHRMCYVLYGGEPLRNRHRDTVQRLLHHAKAGGAEVEAVTNGLELAGYLDVLGQGPGTISRLQIALDADPACFGGQGHGRARSDAFALILANVEAASQTGVAIDLRLHLQPARRQALDSLLDILDKAGLLAMENIHPYAAAIRNVSGEHLDDGLEMVSAEDLARYVKHIGSDVTRHAAALTRLAVAETGPGPMAAEYCMRAKEHCYLLDPFGDIYACYEEAGRADRRVGTYGRDGVLLFPGQAGRLEIGPDAEDAVFPFGLLDGGGCVVATDLAACTDWHVDRRERTREVLLAALGLFASQTLSDYTAQETAPGWRTINFRGDKQRDLACMLQRLAPYVPREL